MVQPPGRRFGSRVPDARRRPVVREEHQRRAAKIEQREGMEIRRQPEMFGQGRRQQAPEQVAGDDADEGRLDHLADEHHEEHRVQEPLRIAVELHQLDPATAAFVAQ